jgi:hypothetical protein
MRVQRHQTGAAVITRILLYFACCFLAATLHQNVARETFVVPTRGEMLHAVTAGAQFDGIVCATITRVIIRRTPAPISIQG